MADALAAEVGLRFLELFVGGSSAREALLAARLALLRRLNPLGLGYTLYGTSDLRFVSRP